MLTLPPRFTTPQSLLRSCIACFTLAGMISLATGPATGGESTPAINDKQPHSTKIGKSFTSEEQSHPNVLVILTDDQGWGDLSTNGNRDIATPRIDSLAQDGLKFDRFYVCAVCSPTRAEFLTGRYHARSGVYSTSAGGERMDLDEVTIADTFRAAGYTTGAFGKWHNGMQYPYHPNGRGFDEYYGFCSGHWGDYFSPPLEHNGQLVQGEGFCIDDFTNRAMKFIERAVEKDEPFFAYLPFNTPHSPMQVPDPFWDRFENKPLTQLNRSPQKQNIGHTRCALAMCENIDWNVGRLLDRLTELNIADDTIVLYFSDNGPNGIRWNGDMKGRKGSTDEGGVRSPLLMRWTGQLPGGKTIAPITSVTDLLPTLAELCNVPIVGTKPLDGRSLAPLLQADGVSDWPDRFIVNQWRGKISIRNQRFRLGSSGALYDIVADPGQRKDVKTNHPEIVREMKAVADRYSKEVAGYDQDERPFLIGHEEYKYTQIPARDAIASGRIERSNRYPNCSFFRNWTSTEETIHWDARVAATGQYQVALQYACSEENVGSEVELSFGNSSLRFKISEAHNPPLRGQENDRVERAESYVKDFKTIDVGTIHLEEGDGQLILKPVSVAGDEIMEFRLLHLTKLD